MTSWDYRRRACRYELKLHGHRQPERSTDHTWELAGVVFLERSRRRDVFVFEFVIMYPQTGQRTARSSLGVFVFVITPGSWRRLRLEVRRADREQLG